MEVWRNVFSETCQAWMEQKHGPGKWSHNLLRDDVTIITAPSPCFVHGSLWSSCFTFQAAREAGVVVSTLVWGKGRLPGRSFLLPSLPCSGPGVHGPGPGAFTLIPRSPLILWTFGFCDLKRARLTFRSSFRVHRHTSIIHQKGTAKLKGHLAPKRGAWHKFSAFSIALLY